MIVRAKEMPQWGNNVYKASLVTWIRSLEQGGQWCLRAFSLNTGGRESQVSESEASLIYRISSRTARGTQKKPLKKQNKTKHLTTTKRKRKKEGDVFWRFPAWVDNACLQKTWWLYELISTRHTIIPNELCMHQGRSKGRWNGNHRHCSWSPIITR